MAHRRLPFYSSALPYWIAGAALWLSEIHRKDIVHLVVGSPLLIIACLSCLAQVRHGICLYAFKVICMSSIALATFNLLVVSAARTKIASRRGTFYAAYAEPVLDFIDAHIPPGKEIFVYPYNPEYYFFSAGKNPTRFSVLMYHINTDAQFREAINSLEQHRVQYVIWGREFSRLARLEGWPAYSNPREEELIIEPYLNQKYRLLIRINGVDIMERRGDLTTLLQTSDGNKYHSQSDVKLSQAIHKALP
jgi:hypothetical protein